MNTPDQHMTQNTSVTPLASSKVQELAAKERNGLKALIWTLVGLSTLFVIFSPSLSGFLGVVGLALLAWGIGIRPNVLQQKQPSISAETAPPPELSIPADQNLTQTPIDSAIPDDAREEDYVIGKYGVLVILAGTIGFPTLLTPPGVPAFHLVVFGCIGFMLSAVCVIVAKLFATIGRRGW